MSEKFESLSQELTQFIERQPMFFVATAARNGRVNLSPKGQHSLKVIGPNEVLWQNLTGSGNETAAHLIDTNRMTIMWCSFEGLPRILRVYGTATSIHPRDMGWKSCLATIPAVLGTRQYFRLQIDLVQTSCGFAVPLMEFQQDRDVLTKWSDKRGVEGIEEYWLEENTRSIDGLPTGIQD